MPSHAFDAQSMLRDNIGAPAMTAVGSCKTGGMIDMSEDALAIMDSTAGRTLALLERLLPPQRNFTVRLWNGDELPATSTAQFSLALKPGALRRMLTPPVELS